MREGLRISFFGTPNNISQIPRFSGFVFQKISNENSREFFLAFIIFASVSVPVLTNFDEALARKSLLKQFCDLEPIVSRFLKDEAWAKVRRFIAKSVEDVVNLYHLAAGISDPNGNHENRNLKQPLKRKIGNAYNEVGKDRML